MQIFGARSVSLLWPASGTESEDESVEPEGAQSTLPSSAEMTLSFCPLMIKARLGLQG